MYNRLCWKTRCITWELFSLTEQRGLEVPPTINYTAPAGDDNRILVVSLTLERDHSCSGNGTNWGSDSYPTISFGGVNLASAGISWQYGGNRYARAEFSSEIYVYYLFAPNFPVGDTGNIVISGDYRSLCAGDESVLMAATFENVVWLTRGNGFGGQFGGVGTSYSTTMATSGGINQPTNSNVSDNLMLGISGVSTDNGDLTTGGAGWTEQDEVTTVNSAGTFNPSGSLPVYSENDGYKTMWQSIIGITGDATATVNWTGATNPAIIGIVPVRLVSVGCEICDNSIDDDGDGLTDCADPECPNPAATATSSGPGM